MTRKISVNNTLAVVIQLLPEQTWGRFTATLNYGALSMAKRKGAPRYSKSNYGNSCSLRCRK